MKIDWIDNLPVLAYDTWLVLVSFTLFILAMLILKQISTCIEVESAPDLSMDTDASTQSAAHLTVLQGDAHYVQYIYPTYLRKASVCNR